MTFNVTLQGSGNLSVCVSLTGTGGGSVLASTPTFILQEAPKAISPPPSVSTNIDRQLAVAWTAPNDGFSPITAYEVVAYAAGNSVPLDQTTVAPGVLSAAFDVPVVTAVGVRVRAINAIGPGVWSAFLNVTTGAGIPGPPTALAVSSVEDRQFTLAWGLPSDSGGLAVSGYAYQV